MKLNLKKGIYSFLIAIFYVVINIYYISKMNFEEDAYIMFRYVEMFVKGYGITFYPGGGHLEGATDFLWFLLLSILNKCYIDTGIASIILNSLGVFIITYILTSVILKSKDKIIRNILFPFSFLWLLIVPVFAAFGGFSVFLYSSIILLTLHLLYKRVKIIWIPILSIIIALFRPDGVILGICFTILGFFLSEKKNRKLYFVNVFIAAIVGISYFLWRYNYFGELLPLPLYVKQATSIWKSFKINIYDFTSGAVIVGIILFVICYILQNKQEKKNIFLLELPSIIFFLTISLAHQSQNIASRFQAPVIYMGYYLIIVMIINLSKNKGKYRLVCVGLFYVLILISLCNSIAHILWTYGHSKRSYINVFPSKLAKNILVDGNTLAVSEAGRIPYWVDKKVKIIDLVGLNTKYTAKNEITESYIAKLDPEVIMIFIHNTFKGTQNVYKISDRNLINRYIYINGKGKEYQAMLVTSKFIYDHWDEYDVFMVRFLDYYPHVYAIKKRLNKSELMFKLLNESFNESSSYWDLKMKKNE
ncbi:hypothetical protein C4S76_04140 [Apibacter adventoris]|nr:hypothetical protein C4S76_04140 [Apibacter adventoris]